MAVCQNSLKLLRLFRSMRKKMLKLSQIIALYLHYLENIRNWFLTDVWIILIKITYWMKSNLVSDRIILHIVIIELVDEIANTAERNETAIGIFLDLSKALDTINHDILLYKLEYYGFRGVPDWFKSYLSNRKQFVRYQVHDSDHKIINCGVPQGSILGPFLFILYINDIVNTTSLLELILFADDTTLLFSHPEIDSQNNIFNNELQKICNWFRWTSYLSLLVRQITWCSVLIIIEGNSLI